MKFESLVVGGAGKWQPIPIQKLGLNLPLLYTQEKWCLKNHKLANEVWVFSCGGCWEVTTYSNSKVRTWGVNN